MELLLREIGQLFLEIGILLNLILPGQEGNPIHERLFANARCGKHNYYL
jgi:hypothetical protein